ncbi:hypothetical protein Plhal703r1_c39g0137611 [Plasmopara halstedii]
MKPQEYSLENNLTPSMSLIEIRQEQVLAKKKRLHHAIDVSTTFVGSELSFTLLGR